MASKVGELDDGLVTPTAVFTTSGHCNVVATGQDKTDFYLVKPCLQWGWNFKLLQGSKRTGEVELLLSKPAFRGTTKVMDPAGNVITELKKMRGYRIRRAFIWEGRECVWQRSSGCWAAKVTFALKEVGSDVVLAEHSISHWSWNHAGTLTIVEAGSHLPAPLVLATALCVEHLWRCRCNHAAATSGAIASAGTH